MDIRKADHCESDRLEEISPLVPSKTYMNLSIHKVHASLLIQPLGPKPTQELEKPLSVSWLAATACKPAHFLRSSTITGRSSLLQDDPAPLYPSILWFSFTITERVVG